MSNSVFMDKFDKNFRLSFVFFRNIDISGPSLISTETLNSEKDGENHYSIGVLVKIDNKEEAYKLDPSKSLDEIVSEVMQILQATSFHSYCRQKSVVSHKKTISLKTR